MLKAITMCGECGSYDWKGHRCIRGAKEDSVPEGPFFTDCPLGDAMPQRHGTWKLSSIEIICTCCQHAYRLKTDEELLSAISFCPYCGAMMDVEEKK